MSHFPFLYSLISGSVGASMPLAAAIILGTFFLEDPTTIIVGVLAADGIIPVPLALVSLYAGIVLGDIALYCLGWAASTHPRLARYVDHDFTAPFRAWLETRYVLTIFSARFIPGARFPTYTTTGFFRSPLSTFIIVAIGATSVWTTFLFSASYWFGSFTAEWMGPVRWSIAGVFLLVLFLVGRHNIVAYRATRNDQDSGDGIRETSV
jgi:membrane protein DedA with SNARE-associated domain